MCGIRAYSEFQLRSREGASFAASAAAQMNKAILLNLRRYDACGLYDVGTAHPDDVTVWETLTSWSLCLDHFYLLLLEISTISISRCVCFHLIVIKGKCAWGARGRGGGGCISFFQDFHVLNQSGVVIVTIDDVRLAASMYLCAHHSRPSVYIWTPNKSPVTCSTYKNAGGKKSSFYFILFLFI